MSLRGVGFVLQCYLMLAAAMYFDLGEQEEKCIIEEIPEDTLVTGHFLLEPWDMKLFSHSPHFGVTVTVRDPNYEVLMSKRYGKFSKFTFTAHASGQHYLCFQTNSTRFAVFSGERLKLHLDVQMGEHPIDPKTDETKNNMEVLENSLRHLVDQMMYITRQQEYQREKEEVFRQISEETNGLQMSYWVCCNSCFLSPSADRKLAVTTCGHVICSVCYGKGKPGKCLICSAKCQVTPLSDKSSSEVKALFSDINSVATKHIAEISKVILFQTRHQKRLLTYYQKRNENFEEVLVKMKQEMQQMAKKLNEQSAYISQLESSLQHQSAKASSVPQMSHSSYNLHGQKSVLQIPYQSPMSLSRRSSTTNITENTDVDERSLFRKPNTVPRLSLISPPQDGRMGTVPHRPPNHNMLANRSARSATVSRFQGSPMTQDMSYGQSSGWKSPFFQPLSFRHNMSSMVSPPPNQTHT
ncbi:probable E3 SUMO-protein ligase RNF212 isoform X2 [Pseudoliparis swirei]|uniref:probable E3 SUMO-protein ligase RNF212 isoform X2 n=1 Tax=Pseudoliparis swirei TaxID=2059687 RepID=UPI0024BE758D|nr:probable E3 SUMO-protein ligase RNF212 isoform X2 [Pseudoliparis swirei]